MARTPAQKRKQSKPRDSYAENQSEDPIQAAIHAYHANKKGMLTLFRNRYTVFDSINKQTLLHAL